MKKINLLLLLSFFFNGVALGQLNDFDKEAFLVGTLDDYMGRQQTRTANADNFHYQKVDIYFQNENKIALLIDSLFKEEVKDLRFTNNGAPKGINIYSKALSERIDEYYSYKPSGSYTVRHDTIFAGSIRKEKIDTEKKKLSFLAGTYLRYGEFIDTNEPLKEHYQFRFKKAPAPDTYWISIPNSVSKAKLCKEILIEEGCKDVEYVVLRDYIPVGHHVIFKPSDKVREVIEKIKVVQKSL